MKVIFLTLALLISVFVWSQEPDTIRAQNINNLEQKIDSLQHTIKSMDKEIQEIKQNMIEGKSEVDELLAIFGEDDVETASFDTRSRRKRVDALLNAITQQPGRLMINGNVTSNFQFANQRDSMESFATGSFDIFATTSFGKGSLLFIDLEAIGGDGPDPKYYTFSGLNADAGSTQSLDGIDRINVLEAWGEFTMFKEAVTITVGKIDLTNYFDNNASANDETMQFISGSFVNNSSFAVPSNSPGVRFRTTFLKRFHAQFGLSSLENKGENIFNDLYRIASLGYTIAPGSDFEANIRIYGYQMPETNKSYGWGISFDEVLFDKYNIFGRYGQNSDSVVDYWGIRSSWSTGIRFVQTIAKQVLAVGVAYGENIPYNTKLNNEKLIEVYLRRQINKWVHITPNFQYVWDAGGTNQELMVFGLRSHFNF